MARDVEADVNINDKSGKGLSSFLSGLRKGSDASKQFQKDADKAAAATDKIGKGADRNGKALAKLTDELGVAKHELGSLSRAFADAGTAAERMDISKAMKRQQAEIRNLTKNAGILKDLAPTKDTDGLVSRLKGSLEEVATAAPKILGAGIAAAAPFAGAVISAAIIGGIGAGGIIGGVTLAAKDPRVQAAFTGMKTRVGGVLTDAAQPFVDTTIDGIGQIEDALDSIDFEAIFAKGAKNAAPIFEGVADAIVSIGDAVEDVTAKSGPVMDQLGASIATVGKETGEFLETVGGGSKGAAAGLHDLTDAFTLTLNILGPTIRGLTEVYGFLSKIGVAKQFITGLFGPIGQLTSFLTDDGGAAEGAGRQIRGLRTELDAAAASTGNGVTKFDQYGQAILSGGDALQTFTDRMNNLAEAGHNVFDSATNVGAAVDAVTAAVRKNGATLDENTEKGRANRDVLSQLATSLKAQYDATVAVNGEGAKSNGVAASNRETFIRLATSLSGSKQKAIELADALGLIKPKKEVDVHANTHDAQARIKALQEQVNALKGKTVNVTVKYSATGRETLDSNGHRNGGYYDASPRFAESATGSNEPARTLSERVDNYLTVQLDGAVIYTTTARQVRAASKRDAWRQKVGRW